MRGGLKIAGITAGIGLLLLLGCANPQPMATPAAEPVPTTTPLPTPTSPPTPSAEVPPTTAPSPTVTRAPVAQPDNRPPGTIFRANLQRTGFYDKTRAALSNNLKWKFQAEGAFIPENVRKYSKYAIGAVQSSPAVADGVVYVGSDDQSLYAVDVNTGQKKWRFLTRPHEFSNPGPVQSSPAVADGVIYFGAMTNHLFAVDAETGEKKWQFKAGSAVLSSPAVANGTVYFGSWDGNLYAVDADTGAEKWRLGTGDRVWSSPALADGVIYSGRG